MTDLTIDFLLTQPFAENTWFVCCNATRRFAVVDPGNGAHMRVGRLLDDGWTCERILLTHAHIDHVWDLPKVKEQTGAPVVMHRDAVQMLAHIPVQAQMFGLGSPGEMPEPEPAYFVDTGDVVAVGESEWWVCHAPGHSPGHVFFYRGDAGPRREGDGDDFVVVCERDDAPGEALIGDLVICNAIGRTDLPGGNLPVLLHSIRERLFRLPESTRLYAGHCEASTIGRELETNDFVGRDAPPLA